MTGDVVFLGRSVRSKLICGCNRAQGGVSGKMDERH